VEVDQSIHVDLAIEILKAILTETSSMSIVCSRDESLADEQ
jgi:hypothetical protein